MGFYYSRVQIIQLALAVEKMGAEFFQRVADLNINEKVKEICQILREEEINHLQTFEQMAADTSASPDDGKRYDLEVIGQLEKLLEWIQNKLFTMKTVDAMTLTSGQLVDAAIHIEEELVLIYESLHTIFSDANRSMIEKILFEEKQHVMLFRNLRDVLRQEAGQSSELS